MYNSNIDNLHLQKDIKQKLRNLVKNLQEESKEEVKENEKNFNYESTSINTFYFYGPPGCGKKKAVFTVAQELEKEILVEDVRKLLQDEGSIYKSLIAIIRDAYLKDSILLILNFDNLLYEGGKNIFYKDYLLQEIRNNPVITFLIGEKRRESSIDYLSLHFPVPPHYIRKNIWEDFFVGVDASRVKSSADDLATKFKFTEGQIREAVYTTMNQRYFYSNGEFQITEDVLLSCCRSQSNQKLSELALKIEPKVSWSDIALPKDQLMQLHDICGQFKYRYKVYDEWGFSKKSSLGKGLNALFSGPSGTGKTMAAEVIAKELDLDMYKIDLSQVVSKYIGETEKNLNKIFSEAETSNAILFFDEADALFGKRSEVRDAHDRYANIEVGYLLQKMEEFEGMTILATNLRRNMDDAFVRRIQFIIDFPLPDEHYRYKIWQIHFPKRVACLTDKIYQNIFDKKDQAKTTLESHIKEKALIVMNNNILNEEKVLDNETFGMIVNRVVKNPVECFTKNEYQEFLVDYPHAKEILDSHIIEMISIDPSEISRIDEINLGNDILEIIVRHTSDDQEACLTQEEYQGVTNKHPHVKEILESYITEKVYIVINEVLFDKEKDLGSEAFGKIVKQVVNYTEGLFTKEEFQAFLDKCPKAKEVFESHINATLLFIRMCNLSEISLNQRRDLGNEILDKIVKFIVKDPYKAMMSDDIDFEFLAENFELTGGNIKNITVSAAFMAAQTSDGEITMENIVRSIKREYMKIGKLIVKKNFGKYYELIDIGELKR